MARTSDYFLLTLLLAATASISGRLIESESEDFSLGEVSTRISMLPRILKRSRKPKKRETSKKKSNKKTKKTKETSGSSKSKLISLSRKAATACRSGKYYGDYCNDEESDCNTENFALLGYCTTGGQCSGLGLCLAGFDFVQCGYIAGIGEIVLSPSVAWDFSGYSATNRCAEVLTGDQDLEVRSPPDGNTLACLDGDNNQINDYTFTSQFNITKKSDVYPSDVIGGSVCEVYDDSAYTGFNRYIIEFFLNDSGDCFEGTADWTICNDSTNTLCTFGEQGEQVGAQLVLDPVECSP